MRPAPGYRLAGQMFTPRKNFYRIRENLSGTLPRTAKITLFIHSTKSCGYFLRLSCCRTYFRTKTNSLRPGHREHRAPVWPKPGPGIDEDGAHYWQSRGPPSGRMKPTSAGNARRLFHSRPTHIIYIGTSATQNRPILADRPAFNTS